MMKGWNGMNKTTFKINVEQKTTQGKLNLITEVDGDIIKSAETIIGFSHKGIEKLAESCTYQEYLNILQTFENHVFYQEAFCSSFEKLQGIEIPEKAMYTRVLVIELERISSHLNWIGYFLENIDIEKTSFDFLKYSKEIQELTENNNYIIFGGITNNIEPSIISNIEKYINSFKLIFEKRICSLNTNIAFRSRIENIGILTKNTAINYAVTGANLRASGINFDERKTNPYLIYNKIKFGVPTLKRGDCFARYLERAEEIKESILIVEQCIEYLKNSDGEIRSNTEKENQKGISISYTESPRGLLNCTVISEGNDKPYRVKWRTPSYYTVQVLPNLLINRNFNDLKTIICSMDISMSEVDR